MKQHQFNLSHCCQSINYRNNGHFACCHAIIPHQLRTTRCDGKCFQRSTDFYQQEQHSYPTYIHNETPHSSIPRWSITPSTCNPLFDYAFHQPSYFENMKIKQKTLDPSSYRVTVRRITPLHVAIAAAEAYQVHKNRDSDRILCESFDSTSASSHQKLRTTQATNIYANDDVNFDNQNTPSVPTKKVVNKNNGIQMSSTSFITTTDTPKSFTSDNVSKTNSEHSKFNSTIANKNDDTTINKTTSDVVNKNQITKQIESNLHDPVEEHLSNNPQSSIDKAEESDSLKFLHDNMSNELNINIPQSIDDPSSSIDNSYFPTLPSSVPPNIESIKSNEMLIRLSRSMKSIPSLKNEKQKSSIDITKSNLSLHTTRSTLDFGFLIDETSTLNF